MDDIVQALIQDFGSADNHLDMLTTSLLRGDMGLDGFFLEIVDPILDELFTWSSQPMYDEAYDVIMAFCTALGNKITNWAKVSILCHANG